MILRLPDSGKRLSYELERKAVGNINLRVRSDGSIYVSAPLRTPQESIESFLIAREKWILRALERVTDRTDAYPDLPVLAQRDRVPYLGGSLRVQYAACNSRKGHWSLDEPAGLLRVELPDPTSDSWRIGALQSFEKQRTQELVQEYLRQYLPLFAARGVGRPPPSASGLCKAVGVVVRAERIRSVSMRGCASGRVRSSSTSWCMSCAISCTAIIPPTSGARWSVICRTGRRGASSGISGAGRHLSSGARKKQGLSAVGRLLLFVWRGATV